LAPVRSGSSLCVAGRCGSGHLSASRSRSSSCPQPCGRCGLYGATPCFVPFFANWCRAPHCFPPRNSRAEGPYVQSKPTLGLPVVSAHFLHISICGVRWFEPGDRTSCTEETLTGCRELHFFLPLGHRSPEAGCVFIFGIHHSVPAVFR